MSELSFCIVHWVVDCRMRSHNIVKLAYVRGSVMKERCIIVLITLKLMRSSFRFFMYTIYIHGRIWNNLIKSNLFA